MSREHEKELLKSIEQSVDDLFEISDQLDSWEVEVGEMILRLQDDTIEKDEFLKLQQLMLADPKILGYYIEFTLTATELYFLFNKKKEQFGIQSFVTA